jgi:hypothetical protein
MTREATFFFFDRVGGRLTRKGVIDPPRKLRAALPRVNEAEGMERGRLLESHPDGTTD